MFNWMERYPEYPADSLRDTGWDAVFLPRDLVSFQVQETSHTGNYETEVSVETYSVPGQVSRHPVRNVQIATMLVYTYSLD